MSIIKAIRTKSAPSKPLLSMLSGGVLSGSVIELGLNKCPNIDYLRTVKHNDLLGQHDLNTGLPVGSIKFDVVFSSYVINYLAIQSELDLFFKVVNSRIKKGGRLVVIARSIAEVNGNAKRTGNWEYNSNLGGYLSKDGSFQKGYDNNVLDALISSYGFDIITNQYDLPPAPYAFTVSRKS
jgi:hypothetical protein